MNGQERTTKNRIPEIAVLLIIGSILVWWSAFLQPRWSDYDFNHYYVSGRMLLTGQNPYTSSLETVSHSLGFRFEPDLPIATYPPAFLWVFAPLALFPPRAAFAIWVASELIFLALILWLTRRLLGDQLSQRGWLLVVVLAVVSRAVTYNLYFSQPQLFLAALVLSGYAALRAGRPGWACVVVSTAGMFKIYPFVLLPWFLWSGGGGLRERSRRLIGVIGFILAVVALTGPGLWRDFFRYSMPTIAGWEEVGRTFHFSLPALLTNLGYASANFHPSQEAKRGWWVLGTCAGLVVFAAAYVKCFLSKGNLEDQFCLLSVAMLIGTVTMQGHYLVFLIFPLTVAALHLNGKANSGNLVFLIVMLWTLNTIDPPELPFLSRHAYLNVLASDLPLYGLLALGVFFWRKLHSRRQFGGERPQQEML